MNSGAGLWRLKVDENGVAFYENASGAVRSEPPEWVQQVDPETGCNYYVRVGEPEAGASGGAAGAGADGAAALVSTWRMPREGALAADDSDDAFASSKGSGGASGGANGGANGAASGTVPGTPRSEAPASLGATGASEDASDVSVGGEGAERRELDDSGLLKKKGSWRFWGKG